LQYFNNTLPDNATWPFTLLDLEEVNKLFNEAIVEDVVNNDSRALYLLELKRKSFEELYKYDVSSLKKELTQFHEFELLIHQLRFDKELKT